MSIADKLSTSLGRRDQVPNQELAAQIAASDDHLAVKELMDLLLGQNKGLHGDAIKTLYEIGALKPELIAPYSTSFIHLLDNKNNRLQWGAMVALNAIAAEKPEEVYASLPRLAAVADAGTVITRDNYVGILIKLLSHKKYSDDAFALLNEQLMSCPSNQLPMYAEQALPVLPESQKPTFSQTLSARLGDFEKESKRKRVEQVLKKLARK